MILTGPGNAPSGHSVTAGQLTFVGTPLKNRAGGVLWPPPARRSEGSRTRGTLIDPGSARLTRGSPRRP